MFSFLSAALRARPAYGVLLAVLALGILASACAVAVTGQPEPEGQSVRVHTPNHVATGLSDSVVGEVDIQLAVPECGTGMLTQCPAKVYGPADYLGKGGSRLIAVDIAAGSYTKADVRAQVRANRLGPVKNLFVLSRGNVLVTGPRNLRSHVLALLRARPSPTTKLGDIPVPTSEPTIHGPSQPLG